MSTKIDYIIVGQGLAGSALALECIKRGKRIMVFDAPGQNRASVISAGICNPITGKGMTKTYLADHLFPFLHTWFAEAEAILGDRFFKPLPIYRPFLSQDEQRQWSDKSLDKELQMFVGRVWKEPYQEDKLKNPHGGLEIRQSGALDVSRWVASVRQWLKEKSMFRETVVNEQEIDVGAEIRYMDLRASHVIFCSGLAARQSRWFGWLPLRPLKGETLTIRMDFPEEMIISRGVYVVPTETSGVFVAGSTYQHEPFAEGNSKEGVDHLRERLEARVSVPFDVIHQGWGIRPTVSDRRPLLGSHPQAGNVIIFNGLGTKGVSLSPYFASALADWMDKGPALPEEVNISRFKALYSN